VSRTTSINSLKHLALGALKLPLNLATTTVGRVTGAATSLLPTTSARDSTTADVQPGEGSPTASEQTPAEPAVPKPTAPKSAAPKPASPRPAQPTKLPAGKKVPPSAPEQSPHDVDPGQPVNVVEELGLDPAPVDSPAPTAPTGESRPDPVTDIDALGSEESTDASPADVAAVLAEKSDGDARD
jgi:hypothetical protein